MLVSSARNRSDFAKSRETPEFAYAVTSLSCFDHEGCHRQPLEMTRIHFQSGSKSKLIGRVHHPGITVFSSFSL
jgi:hypothetical protein